MSEKINSATKDMMHAEATIRKCLKEREAGIAISQLHQTYRIRSEYDREVLFLALAMRVVSFEEIAKAKERRRLAEVRDVDPRNKSEGDGLGACT